MNDIKYSFLVKNNQLFIDSPQTPLLAHYLNHMFFSVPSRPIDHKHILFQFLGDVMSGKNCLNHRVGTYDDLSVEALNQDGKIILRIFDGSAEPPAETYDGHEIFISPQSFMDIVKKLRSEKYKFDQDPEKYKDELKSLGYSVIDASKSF